VDSLATKVFGNRVNLYVWYDNEFGYACQVVRGRAAFWRVRVCVSPLGFLLSADLLSPSCFHSLTVCSLLLPSVLRSHSDSTHGRDCSPALPEEEHERFGVSFVRSQGTGPTRTLPQRRPGKIGCSAFHRHSSAMRATQTSSILNIRVHCKTRIVPFISPRLCAVVLSLRAHQRCHLCSPTHQHPPTPPPSRVPHT
jgi:hypothetical protein